MPHLCATSTCKYQKIRQQTTLVSSYCP